MHREEPLWNDKDRPRDLEATGDTPSQLAQASEVLGQLRAMVPEDRRTVLDLKALGLSSREIGIKLGVSERTIQRIIEDLRKRAEDSDLELK